MNRFIILLSAALLLPVGESLHAQYHSEDWPSFPKSSNKYYQDLNILNFPAETWNKGELHAYTDNIENPDAPLYIYLENHYTENPLGLWSDYGFYVCGLNSCEKTFSGYCSFWWNSIHQIEAYRKISERLDSYTSRTGIELSFSVQRTSADLFRDTNSLEWTYIGASRHQTHTMGEGMFRDCANLKYAEFDANILNYEQDIFLNCPKLEIIKFNREPPSDTGIYGMFNTNYNYTGPYNYPNLKAFVVPDAHVTAWYNLLRDHVCQAIVDGWVKVISHSEWNGKKVRGISLNRSSVADMFIYNTVQLTATVNPADAYNKGVTWSSSNPSAATVSNSGLVTAVGGGYTVITARTAEYGYTATCGITVPAPVTGIHLNTVEDIVDIGATLQLTSLAFPPNTYDGVTWSSNNPAVATVSATGLVTAVSAGSADIRVTAVNGGFTTACKITVPVPVSGITLNASALTLPGDTVLQLTATVAPLNAMFKDITWSSSNPSVADVFSNGFITAKAHGTAVITATSARYGSVKASCTVTVKDVDPALKSLSVSGGTLDPVFTRDGTFYSVTVPHNTDYVNVTAETNSLYATVSGTGRYNLKDGNNPVQVRSVSENGTAVREYTVYIYRKSSDIRLGNLTVASFFPRDTYALLPAFKPDIFNYRVAVPSLVSDVTVTVAKSNDPQATVTHVIDQSLTVGDNTVSIPATDGDGTKETYTLTVRRLSDNADIYGLSVNGVNLSPPLAPGIFVYTGVVPYSVDGIIINAYPADWAGATVSGAGYQSLSAGENILPVTISAEDGTKKFYTLKIKRLSNDTGLQFLSVNERIFPSPVHSVYYDTVPYLTDHIAIRAVANNPDAAVIAGDYEINVGDTAFQFTVTAEDPSINKTYTLMSRRLNNDVTIKSLQVSEGELYPAFHPDTLDYAFNVENAADRIEITVEPADDNATVTGNGVHSLDFGNNIIKVVIAAEDPVHNRTYTLTVNRPANGADLGFLTVSPGFLSPPFHRDTLSYTVIVANAADSITVTAFPAYATTSLSGTGYYPLTVGNNSFSVTATAEDGAERIYTVDVYRMSSDAALKSLTVSPGVLSPPFDPATPDYTVNVENETESVVLAAEVNSAVASVTGAGAYAVNVGDNPLPVTVTAEDGTVGIYTITVHRISLDATLKSFTIDPAKPVPPFDPEITQYTASVPYPVSSITLDMEVNYPLATCFIGNGNDIEQPGIKYLDVGENVFGISVFAENESYYRTYWIWITREDLKKEETPAGFDYRRLKPMAIKGIDGGIEIDSPIAERVNIYSVTGTLLYSFDKPAGAFTLSPLRAFAPSTFRPSPVLIVKGSSGWSGKLMINN